MYAYGTTQADIAKMPVTDTMQPNPLYKPQNNAQKNDQQWGQGNWAYATTQQQPQQPAAPQAKQSGSMDFSAYAPGKAQPTQTPSLGTAYGQPAATQQPMQANPYANMQPGVYTPTGQFFGGNPAQGLAQAQQQRDAFVQQSMQATLPYTLANVFGQDLGAPNYDFQAMLGRANKMVEDGFYNPFTQYFSQPDPMQQPAPAQFNPYMPSDTGWWGMGPKPTAPPMQADPYQEWLSSLPGYQSRDQWMTKQPTPRYGEPSYRVLSPFAARGRRGY
jgi:hypothetical protein